MELRPLQPAGEGSEATAAGQAHSGSPVRLSAQASAWTNLLGTEFTDGQRCRGQGSWPQLLPSYRAEHGSATGRCLSVAQEYPGTERSGREQPLRSILVRHWPSTGHFWTTHVRLDVASRSMAEHWLPSERLGRLCRCGIWKSVLDPPWVECRTWRFQPGFPGIPTESVYEKLFQRDQDGTYLGTPHPEVAEGAGESLHGEKELGRDHVCSGDSTGRAGSSRKGSQGG